MDNRAFFFLREIIGDSSLITLNLTYGSLGKIDKNERNSASTLYDENEFDSTESSITHKTYLKPKLIDAPSFLSLPPSRVPVDEDSEKREINALMLQAGEAFQKVTIATRTWSRRMIERDDLTTRANLVLSACERNLSKYAPTRTRVIDRLYNLKKKLPDFNDSNILQRLELCDQNLILIKNKQNEISNITCRQIYIDEEPADLNRLRHSKEGYNSRIKQHEQKCKKINIIISNIDDQIRDLLFLIDSIQEIEYQVGLDNEYFKDFLMNANYLDLQLISNNQFQERYPGTKSTLPTGKQKEIQTESSQTAAHAESNRNVQYSLISDDDGELILQELESKRLMMLLFVVLCVLVSNI